ncbi:hypothetical protein JJB07_00545 [Tumebacillus sp. ITR2]|uniref:Bacterial transcriptional activator domain-containing protein n=1 Tax=Tumebacillus amylolyticus TaxID=2801339 RepID=A0ABS1J4B7_9BACL|nr:hypothetical protein [Tumebacillus amylolyticus]MBL0385119.1 hypothetical protein [Tumebacillus amylolyticus]
MAYEKLEKTTGFGYTIADNAHCRLMMLEDMLNTYVGQINLAKNGYVPQFGIGQLNQSTLDYFEDLLNELSFARVAKIYNDLAEDYLKDFEADNQQIFLEDAYNYLSISVSVSPTAHVERARAYTLMGSYYAFNGQPDKSYVQLQEAYRVLEGLGNEEQVERARKQLEECRVQK